MALFLKVLMTVPSFLRRSGELRLSATFCFNRDRTFRLGSETADRKTTQHGAKKNHINDQQPTVFQSVRTHLFLCVFLSLGLFNLVRFV